MKRELRGKKSRKQRGTAENPNMGQDLFTYIPPEMIMEILSRLPIRSIIQCKLVCKSWRDLLATPEFVMKFHLSKSVAGLAVFTYAYAYHPKPYKLFEFVDELNLNRRAPRWNMVTLFNFNLPCAEPLHSSANGLLFLCGPRDHDLVICNPITRDYIMIPYPQESSFSKYKHQLGTFGFGVSRMSGQYKLVWMLMHPESEFQVYTVGTGSWRRVGFVGRPLMYEVDDTGTFLSGNLHWLAREMEGSSLWISCLDLETELFSLFSPPHLHCSGTRRTLSTLRECLCVCDNSADNEIVIWLMKDYGDEKSWTKEFIIPKMSALAYHYIRPIKVFENGDILMTIEACSSLIYFTSKTKSIRHFDVFRWKGDYSIRAIMYTPSFVPLRTFAMENVASF